MPRTLVNLVLKQKLGRCISQERQCYVTITKKQKKPSSLKQLPLGVGPEPAAFAHCCHFAPSTRAEGATSVWNILSCSGKRKQGHDKVIKPSVNFACFVREQLS